MRRTALLAVLCACAVLVSHAETESGSRSESVSRSEGSLSESSALSGLSAIASLSGSRSHGSSSSLSSLLGSGSSGSGRSSGSSSRSASLSSSISASALPSLSSLRSGSSSSSLPNSLSVSSAMKESSSGSSSPFVSASLSLPGSSSSAAIPPPPPVSSSSSSSGSSEEEQDELPPPPQKKKGHRYTVVKNNNKLMDIDKAIPPKQVNEKVEQEQKRLKRKQEDMQKLVIREDLAKKDATAELKNKASAEDLKKKIYGDQKAMEAAKKKNEMDAHERSLEINKKARVTEEHAKLREAQKKKEISDKLIAEQAEKRASEQKTKSDRQEQRKKHQETEQKKAEEASSKSQESSFKEQAKKKGMDEIKIRQESTTKTKAEQNVKEAAELNIKKQAEATTKSQQQEERKKKEDADKRAEDAQKLKEKHEADKRREEDKKRSESTMKAEAAEKGAAEQRQKAESLAQQKAQESKHKGEQKEKGNQVSEAETKSEERTKAGKEAMDKQLQEQLSKATEQKDKAAKHAEEAAQKRKEKEDEQRTKHEEKDKREKSAEQQKKRDDAESAAIHAEQKKKQEEADRKNKAAQDELAAQAGKPTIVLMAPKHDDLKLPYDIGVNGRDQNAGVMEAANIVCQDKGYAYAVEWTTDQTGAAAPHGTARFDSNGNTPRVCAACRWAFASVTCQKEDPNSITIRDPRHSDSSFVDATTVSWNGAEEWAGNQQASNLFCRSKGYDGAIRWQISKTEVAGRGTTRFIGDGHNGKDLQRCDKCGWSLKMVVCRRKPNRGHRALGDPSPNAGVFTYPVFGYPGGWNFEGVWTFKSRAAIVGDFNGDGKTDYARLGGTYIHFFISKGNGQYHTPIYPFPRGWDFTHNEGLWTSLKATDMDGDGKSDIVRTYYTYNHGFRSAGSDEECWLRDGWVQPTCMEVKTFQYPSGWNFQGVWAWGGRSTIQGDFNGDGMGDYARLGATYIHFFISKGKSGEYWWPIYAFPTGWNFGWDENAWTSLSLDLNGDGRTDIVRTSARYNHVFIAAANPRCWQTNGWIPQACFQIPTYTYIGGWFFSGGWSFNQNSLVVGDFNGDGFDDFGKLGATYIHFFISKGNGQFYSPVFPFPPGWNFGWNEDIWATLPQADFDGDGKIDIIRSHYTYHHGFYARGGDQQCFYKTITQFSYIPVDCFKITTFRYPGGWHFSGGWSFAQANSVIVGDFNGDGKDDYINLGGGRYNHQFFAS